MAISSQYSCNSSQAAEKLLSRARRLSNNAFERTRLPTAFAEGESHLRLSANAPHQYQHSSYSSSYLLDPSRRGSFTIQPRRRATTIISTSSSSSTSSTSSRMGTASSNDSSKLSAPLKTGTVAESSSEKQPLSDAAVSTAPDGLSTSPNTFLDQSHAHALACATSTMLPPSSLSSCPRALHCEGARDCTLEQDDTDAAHVAEEDHRKNLSENGGGGLVYGVLAALRQNTELESSMPFGDTASKLAASPIPLMIASPGDKTMSVIECSPTVAIGISDARDPALEHIVSATEQTSSVSDSTSPPAPETPELDGISLAVSDETRETCPTTPQNTGTLGVKSTDHAQCSHKEDLTPTVPETKMLAESPAPTSPSSSSSKSTGAVDQERKDFKEGSKGAYLLHRMGMRKNSFTEHAANAGKDSSDSSSIKSHTSHLSAQSSQSGKNSKRSSKLLGKFVPKFLQTSTPTVSTAGFSPLSQSASLPSASTRSSRSSSMTDHNPGSVDEGMTATEAAVTVSRPSSTSASSKGSQESLPLYHTPEEEEKVEMVVSPTQISASALDYLECLRTGSSRSPSLGRRSSCSSDASKRSENSDGPQPSDSSMTSVDSMDDGLSNSGLKIGKGINSVDVEVNADKVEAHSSNNTNVNDGKTQDGSLPMSPYVIDETCDDEFFLNSVLRKKSYASLDLEAERPRMPTSFSSNTTMGSDRSYATTPPLSGCSSSSSRASTPSPTSPMMSGHTYPFASTFSKEMQLRSNPLPSPVNLGLDEKRRRLRDAVSEWRRSTNVSL